MTCKEDDKCNGKLPTTVSMGLCLPNECDNSDINEILPDMLYLINSLAIPYEFSHL